MASTVQNSIAFKATIKSSSASWEPSNTCYLMEFETCFYMLMTGFEHAQVIINWVVDIAVDLASSTLHPCVDVHD